MGEQRDKDREKQDGGSGAALESRAPDGGYGWVIVASSFVLSAMIDGTFSATGVLVPEFVQYFSASLSKVAAIGSVMGGTLLMAGPLVGGLVTCFGCRLVSMVGGLLTTVGILSAAFSPNVTMLIVTFGFLTGLGLSMMYVPSVVAIGFYFTRRRAMASGIGTAGSGIGMVIMAPFTAFLIQRYDWKNALVFIAGISLQTVVAGALLRPLTPRRCTREANEETETPIAETLQTKPVMDHSEKSENEKLHPTDRMLDNNISLHSVTLKTHDTDSRADNEVRLKLESEIIVERDKNLKAKHKRIRLLSENDADNFPSPQTSRKQTMSMSLHSIAHQSPLIHRKHLFYSGSIHSGSIHYLPTFQSFEHVDNGQENVKEAKLELDRKSARSKCVSVFKHILDLSLFTNSRFVVVTMANVFFQMGFMIPTLFIPDYGISVGIDPAMAAMFLSVYGVATLLGRGVGGVVGNLPSVNPAAVSVASLLIAACMLVAVPFCTTFLSITVCVAAIGVMLGPLVPLSTVFLVDAVGLERFTSAIGLLSMMKGIANFVGAPIAGALFDMTGSYMGPFVFAGAIYLCSGASMAILYVMDKHHNASCIKTVCGRYCNR